jgi:amino acid transporter
MATAYGSGPIILLCAIPMLIIANAYRRLNMWNANCGASFEWVGRAINPYLGFMTGWLMVAGYIIGTAGTVVVLGPSVLAVFGAKTVAILPLGAIAFLVWVLVKSPQAAPASQVWALVGILAVGVILMLAARLVMRSTFFQVPRESDDPARPQPA